MKVTFTKTWGQFAVSVECEIAEKQQAIAATLGALHVFERSPSSAIEQELVGPDEGWEMGEKGKSYKRPVKWNRASWDFSEERALDMKKVFETTPGKLDENEELNFKVVSITKHEGGDSGTTRKMAEAFVAKATADGNAEFLPTMLGCEKDADTATLVEAAHAKFFAKKK